MTFHRAMKCIGAVMLVGVVGVLVYATTRPSTFHVSRSAIINAPPGRIYAFINDFRQWSAWSPFHRLDPAVAKTFSGASAGKGAVYEWNGNRRVGRGRMEIVDTALPSKVSIKLDVSRPFDGHDSTEFTLAPDGGSTRVTWTIDGPTPYSRKVVGIFFDLDALIGNDFDLGLANLKALSEQ